MQYNTYYELNQPVSRIGFGAFGLGGIFGKFDLTEELKCGEPDIDPAEKVGKGIQYDFFTGVSKYHPVDRMPKEFFGLTNGHYGSHHFLVDDFCRSVIENKLAPNHVWAAARYTVPGLVAHE